LALEAAKETLGKNIVSKGPIMKKVVVKNGYLVVKYTNANGLKIIDGKSPSGFWIADNTMQWKPAKASIKGQTVILNSNEIKKPLYIRYAFSGKPSVNLVNSEGLPAYPFRTDAE
jgi:sialate O-acetylesterase